MTRSLLYRLFGAGKISDPLLSQLQSEGLVALEEGVKGSATFRNFRKPGMRSFYRRQWCTASIALTKKRLFAQWYSNTIVDLPLDDKRIQAMHFSLEGSDSVFCIGFDASLFHRDWS